MAKKKQNIKGEEAFDLYYSEVFGHRWQNLKKALFENPRQMGYSQNLLQPYFLDCGSVKAAMSLPLEGATTILDMCAAPGGKSLVLASKMPEDARLTANERSFERKIRLTRVLDEHLPDSIRSRIKVTGFDASKWCTYETETFDRILLDVPCSSERHVLTDPTYLALWTPARIRNLSATQWSILSSAFRVLKRGGYMVYSTCALSKAENDDVLEKLLKKQPSAKIIQLEINEEDPICAGERTKYGVHVLPDMQNGAGPLFFSLIYKQNMD